MIEVNQIGDGDPLEFEVMVREASGESRHHVTMSKETYDGGAVYAGGLA